MIETGKHILNYEILSVIGEGGMGTVYLCTDLLQRKLAIKILNPVLTNNQVYIDRFLREAKTLASVEHPGIVKVFHFFKNDGDYFMVMEFAEGETLKSLIKRKGPTPEQNALIILKRIADALCFAHINGIIHRDIKPENIMIDKDDNIKILDFGIAKLLNDNRLTRTGTTMGTISYMSPEQIKETKDIDLRTDIYSLGIVFYEILTGKLPFHTDTDSDFMIMKEIIEGEIKDPRLYYPHISDSTVNLLRRMTAKDKEMRMASLDEVLTFEYKNGNNFQNVENLCNKTPNDNDNDLPEFVICDNCKEELELEEDEIKSGYYICPNCITKHKIKKVTTNQTGELNDSHSEHEYTRNDKRLFRHPFTTDGRIRRTEYGFSLIIFYLVILFINTIAKESSGASFMFLFFLPSYWFILSQGAKRCHDMNNSGWYQLIPFYVLVMLFKDGDIEDNNYGPNPKGINNDILE